MWNPEVFPSNPERATQALNVSVWTSGMVTSYVHGQDDGMQLYLVTETEPDGSRWLHFPFSIDGF